MHKYKNMKQYKAAILLYSKPFNFFSMDTKIPINPTSDGNHYIHLIVDQFINYKIIVPTPANVAH